VEHVTVDTKRRFSVLAGVLKKRGFVLPLLVLLLPLTCQNEPARAKYNVILISIDTLRAGHLSCYGYRRTTSPTIDEFAENALLFTNAFSAAPSTLASHMSIFTSVSPSVHQMMNYNKCAPLSRKIKTLPELLKAHGYATYGYYDTADYSETSLLGPQYGFDRGFDSYKRKIGKVIYRVVKLVKRKPTFLFLHYFDVHYSGSSDYLYDGPPEFRDKFTQSRLNRNPNDVLTGKEKLTEKELEQVIARYDGGIVHVDSQIKELFDLLKKEGLFEQSLIILTSDHGESLGFKGMMDNHGWLYNVGTHVPLIIKFPGDFHYSGPLRGKVDFLVRTIDIMPTILEVLSIDAPPYIEGKSLLSVTEDRMNYARMLKGYSVRTADSMILFNSEPDFAHKDDIEIYDLKRDPLEHVNLTGTDEELLHTLLAIAEHEESKAESLRNELDDNTQEIVTLDQKDIDGLKALGYIQ
jgi:arylsulfatase A-like enzyme